MRGLKGRAQLEFDSDYICFVGELVGENDKPGAFFALIGEFEIDYGEIDIDRDHTEEGFFADVEDVGAFDVGVGAGAVFGDGSDQFGEGGAELGVGGEDDVIIVAEGERT